MTLQQDTIALPLPFISKLSEQFKAGQTLSIRGTINSDAKEFQVNLLAGTAVIDEHAGSVVFHLNDRYDDKKIVMNSLEAGKWGKEERVSNVFKKGEPFDLRIRALDDKFEIVANQKEIHEFKYRLPLAMIDHLNVLGDITLYNIHWGGRFYSLPYETGFPKGHLPAGDRVLVYGTPTGKTFEVNFIGRNNDVLFHFNCRMGEKAVVRNSCVGSQWQTEEREGGMPFKKDIAFDLVIVNEPYSIQIFVNNERFATFAHRTRNPDNDYVGIRVDGELELTGLEFTHS